MHTLVCHRCGFTAMPGGVRVQCPADGLFLVHEDEHRRAPRDTYLGGLLGGRYPILGLIGQGGMGSVYRSIQPHVERPVAIKVIHPRVTVEPSEPRPRGETTEETDEVSERFLREAKLIAGLNHPNIVTLYDFGVESDGTLFMVQELIEGDSLRRALPAMTPRALVAACVQLLWALDAAHGAGLIHRDVKPENAIVLSPWQPDSTRNRLKLLDFGIARRVGVEDSGRLTTQGAIFGTPAYMSPEQAQGSDAVDARTDLYAVGVLLYEGLMGRPPYAGPNALAVLVQVLAGARAPLVLPPGAPPGLGPIVERALSKEPEDRFRSAEEMAAALERLRFDEVERVLETGQLVSGTRTLSYPVPVPSLGPGAALAVTDEVPMARAGVAEVEPAAGELEPAPRRGAGPWVAAVLALAGLGLGATLLTRGAPTSAPDAAVSAAVEPAVPVTAAPVTAAPVAAAPVTAAPVTAAPATAPASTPASATGRKPKAPRAPGTSTGAAPGEPEEILAPPPR